MRIKEKDSDWKCTRMASLKMDFHNCTKKQVKGKSKKCQDIIFLRYLLQKYN